MLAAINTADISGKFPNVGIFCFVGQMETDELDDAIDAFEEAIRINPNYAEAHCQLGLAWFKAEDLEQAIGCFQRAILHKRDYPDPHFHLARVYDDQGLIEKAQTARQSGLALTKDKSNAQKMSQDQLDKSAAVGDAAGSAGSRDSAARPMN